MAEDPSALPGTGRIPGSTRLRPSDARGVEPVLARINVGMALALGAFALNLCVDIVRHLMLMSDTPGGIGSRTWIVIEAVEVLFWALPAILLCHKAFRCMRQGRRDRWRMQWAAVGWTVLGPIFVLPLVILPLA